MRDYKNIDNYINRLLSDIYPQPEDAGHFYLAKKAIDDFMPRTEGVSSVLDAGCGEAFCQQFFEEKNIRYCGVCLGNDYEVSKAKGRRVFEQDFSFLSFDDDSFDLVFSRHSLEHSPIPLMTLMEWHRVTKRYVALVLPAPEHWRYGGRNHYFVLSRKQWRVLFEAAGFDIIHENVKRKIMRPDNTPPDVAIEYWFILEKKKKETTNEN